MGQSHVKKNAGGERIEMEKQIERVIDLRQKVFWYVFV